MSFRLVWPCNQGTPVTQYFMNRPAFNPDFYAQFGLPGHDGIDFGTSVGAPLFAAANGQVLTVGFQANGYGNFIRFRHTHNDGIFITILAHLDRVSVTEGQRVNAGDPVGYAGNTGASSGPHLHFSLQWEGATQRGFTSYRGYGRTVTFPRDFIDPAPYLMPPITSPAQPTNPNHPALTLPTTITTTSAQPQTNATIQSVSKPIGVRVVNTAQFNGLAVRAQPQLNANTITRVTDGTKLVVKANLLDGGQVKWRQIITPDNLKDNWLAESFETTQYLEHIPADEVETNRNTTATNPRTITEDDPTPPTDDNNVQKPTPDAVGMKVINTMAFNGLAVRPQPRTDTATITRLSDGATLWVKPAERNDGMIIWRQLVAPAQYQHMWVAQSFNNNAYLQQIADSEVEGEQPTVSTSPATTPQPVGETTAPATSSVTERLVVINTGAIQLKVRTAPSTTNSSIVTTLPDGTVIEVAPGSTFAENITWRQIVQPANIKDNWVAQSFFNTRYLIPALDDTQPAAEAPVEPVSTPVQSTTPTINLNTIEPAPLTGRFQIVDRGVYSLLSIDGDITTRMGVNVRELAYFGTPEWRWTNDAQRVEFLEEARAHGMKWVRFYAPHKNYTIDEIIPRVRITLDEIADAGLIAVVVLADSLAETGLYPAGDEGFHTASMGHYEKGYWHGKHYETNYIPMLQRIVSEFKDHPGVGMWQLMNEPAIYPQPASQADSDAFAAFVDRASGLIYEMDTVHPISIGIINVAHVAPSAANQEQFPHQYFAARKYIHVATCHCYQHTNNGDPNTLWDQEDRSNWDAAAAAATERAYMLTEFGSSQAGNRTQSSEAFLRRQLQGNNATGALQWGFMPTSNDVGVGDSHFGLSPANINKEYDQLVGLYRDVRNRIHLV